MGRPNSHEFDPATFSNQFEVLKDTINLKFEMLGGLLSSIQKNTERAIRKEWKSVYAEADTIVCNFKVMTIYVDNSQNANSITINPPGAGSFEIAANSQEWIHPLGIHEFDVTGSGSAKVMMVDTFLPIK